MPGGIQVGRGRESHDPFHPEGHDKPLKYPLMFTESNALILNKIDLLPHTDFSMEELRKTVTAMNPNVKIFPLSAKTGEGIGEFTAWLDEKISGSNCCICLC